MYKGQCHCGSVQFVCAERPEKLVDCNCSICRRLGALWGHVSIDSVDVIAADDATIRYIQGDKTLAVNTCRNCGCTTHYESLQQDGKMMAVNFRMCEPGSIKEFQIRKFDGADSWTFID